MTWSISVGAPTKAEAKRRVTLELPKSMLHQVPHARDFEVVLHAIHGAIDACAEGVVTVSGGGYLSGNWVEGDIPEVRGVHLNLVVSSTTAQ